ncbi:hypothetical protein [Pseudomonas amygdali]|uniref:Uncharacterized protein n=1 Tax=Pseudomonas amygdali pv. lachrymans str. M301315 TaxID=629260 RepID=A0AAD0PX13_PSEAV|nr:hypothetical protein [Pseudomonas amygdali]AXH60286.1 hypothetical protein PLA107_034450 [Pseudomonas amygdali pv. lachrymans str. M301315]
MSDIKEDLAYRGELNRRLQAAKMPFEYGLLWSLREGKEREVASRIKMMSEYNKFPTFFRLDLTEADLENLYSIDTYNIQRQHLLLGVANYLEQEDVTPDQGYKVMPLIDLLASKKFFIDDGDDRSAFLKGRLYFALKKIMPAIDALRTFEHFVSYDQKRFHNAIYNSFFERAISLAFKGGNPLASDDDLRAIASCRHMTFIDEEGEVSRWIAQLSSIGSAIRSRNGEDSDALVHLGHTRAKHLMLWLQRASSVEAMRPFMPTKTIVSSKNASDTFAKYVAIMSALNSINSVKALGFDTQTILTRHAFKVLSRFLDKLDTKNWQSLADTAGLPIDWPSVLKKFSVEQQEAVLLKLPHLLSSVTNKAREHHFMGDLGL